MKSICIMLIYLLSVSIIIGLSGSSIYIYIYIYIHIYGNYHRVVVETHTLPCLSLLIKIEDLI